jgi:hypothetical protein
VETSTDAILLVGGNSQIGNALAKGIAKRLNCHRVIRVVRSKEEVGLFEELTYQVRTYSEFDYEELAENFEFKAIIISFGVLEVGTKTSSVLAANLQVNTIETLRTIENLMLSGAARKNTEIHFTSSLLADFTRESVFSYSVSKSLVERVIIKDLKPIHKLLFIWKLPYVATKLNSGRPPSPISVSLEGITRYARIRRRPGVHYVPKFSRYPCTLLKAFPQIHRYIK